jgi:hypothetical protein
LSVVFKATFDDQVSPGLNKVQKELKQTGTEATSFGSKLSSVKGSITSFGSAAGLAFAGVAASAGVAFAAISKLSNDFDAMDDAMSAAVGNTGKTRDELDSIAKSFQDASDQSLTYTQSLQALSKGVQNGVLGISDMGDIIAIANVKAKQTGQDTAAVVAQMTEAISKGSAEQLMSMGLLEGGMDGVRGAYDKASSEGVGAFDKLTESQKKLAITQEALKNAKDLGPLFKESGLVGSDGMDEFNRSIMDAYKSLTEVAGSSDFKVFLSEIAKGINDYAIPAIEGIPTAIDTVMKVYHDAVDTISESIAWWGETLRILPEGTTKAVKEASEQMEIERARAKEQAEKDSKAAKEQQDKASAEIAKQQEARKKAVEENKKWEQEQKDAKSAAAEQQKKDEKELTELKKAYGEQLKENADVAKKAWEEEKKRLDEQIGKLEKLKGLQGEAVKNTRSFLKPKGSTQPSSSGSIAASSPDMSQVVSAADQPKQAVKGTYAQSLAAYGALDIGGSLFPEQAQLPVEGGEGQQDLVGQMIGGLKRKDVLKSLALTNNISSAEASRQLKSGKLTDEDFVNAQAKTLRDRVDKDSGNVKLSTSDVLGDKYLLKELGKGQGFGGNAKDIESIKSNVNRGAYSEEDIQAAYKKLNPAKLNQRQAQALQEEIKDRQTSTINEIQGAEDYNQISGYVSGKGGVAKGDDLGNSIDKQSKMVDSQKSATELAQKQAESTAKIAETMTELLNSQNEFMENTNKTLEDFRKVTGQATAASKKAAAAGRN